MTAHLRSEIIARARAGDIDAVETLVRCCPNVLPRAERQAWRDKQLVETAEWLRQKMRDLSANKAASIIGAAGRRLLDRRLAPLPDAKPFGVLDSGERAELAKRISATFCWSDDKRWPSDRRLRCVLADFGWPSRPA